MFDHRCLDCPAVVTFDHRPGDARCSACGLRMYLTDEGAVGRYLREGWEPGGFQGHSARRRAPEKRPDGGE